ncbi:MAG: CsbD family protein [Planctomycetia bacterium]|nr:CsbD family protein [Planctomycetia bacterium]
MIDQATLQGSWNQVRGKLREKWGQLTDDDLARFDGNVEQLVGKIQRKTGEAKQSVEHFLEELSNGSASVMQRAEGYVHQAAEQVRDTTQRVRDGVGNGYAKAEGMVQSRPAESVVVAFGCGLAVGIGVALLLGRDRPSDTLWNRSRETGEGLARRMVDAVASRCS